MSYSLLNEIPGYMIPKNAPANTNIYQTGVLAASGNIVKDNILAYSDNRSTFNPNIVDEYAKLIHHDRYNGRVNIAEPEDPTVVFRMAERIAIKNKAVEYREALEGNWENNVIAQVYFSAENMQIIQNGLRAGVYQMSNNKIVVPPQNVDALRVIMRSIYLQYAQHYGDRITEQVENLNQYVLNYAVPFVYNEAIAYKKYLIDQSTLVTPLHNPIQSDRNYKQLELKPWF